LLLHLLRFLRFLVSLLCTPGSTLFPYTTLFRSLCFASQCCYHYLICCGVARQQYPGCPFAGWNPAGAKYFSSSPRRRILVLPKDRVNKFACPFQQVSIYELFARNG